MTSVDQRQANRTQDQTITRNNVLYSVDDPIRAFNNALIDKGYNPYGSNPFMRRYQQVAPGLSTAFLMEAAANNRFTDLGNDPGKLSSAFKDYVSGAIAGGDGGAYQRLASGFRNIGPAVQRIRDFEQQLMEGGVTAGQVNPFLTALRDRFAADEGEGTVRAILSLAAPNLAPSVARAYGSGLSSVHEMSLRNLGYSPNMFKEDIWTYMLGKRGSGAGLGW